jgi:hypothetical protein
MGIHQEGRNQRLITALQELSPAVRETRNFDRLLTGRITFGEFLDNPEIIEKLKAIPSREEGIKQLWLPDLPAVPIENQHTAW